MLLLKSLLKLLEFTLFDLIDRKSIIVTPETILFRWKRAIKDYWTYDKPKTREKGRPPDILVKSKRSLSSTDCTTIITELAELIIKCFVITLRIDVFKYWWKASIY